MSDEQTTLIIAITIVVIILILLLIYYYGNFETSNNVYYDNNFEVDCNSNFQVSDNRKRLITISPFLKMRWKGSEAYTRHSLPSTICQSPIPIKISSIS